MADAEIRDAFGSGVNAGIERASRYELEPQEGFENSLEQMQSVLEPQAENLSSSFMELFVENATVAIIARGVFEPENPLSDEDLKNYLEHSVEFFNSFNHRL